MKKGAARFDHYLNQFAELLTLSSKQKNPALWLYQHGARTPLFMLEGLARVYAGLHNKKKFGKLKEQFKVLEDAIGAIDYYDAFAKEFARDKKIPATIKSYILAQSREKIQSLNEILTEKEWISVDNSRIGKIRKKLAGAEWLSEKDEIERMQVFYTTAVKSLLNSMNEKNFHFDNVEADIHEIRRDLRWLSIYPQALGGCIQLNKAKTTPKYLAKYATKEITGSPFNIMPDAGDCKHFLLLDKSRFYALSWLIAELGKLKDTGLRVVVIEEAILQTTPQGKAGKTAEADALKKTYHLLGPKQPKQQQLLDEAEIICKTYFKEKNLESLITGVATVK
ncbi:MAG: hypothetical protein IPH68_00155 [Chitinophagaceae bacterium]|nr:hypothetical protein [Chitinophagaceae bacterium]MBK9532525.1 hypothetical protein [Chitinophagaceae bacterium]